MTMMMIPCVSVSLKGSLSRLPPSAKTNATGHASGGPAAANDGFWCAWLTGLGWTLMNPYSCHMQGGFAEDSGNE